MVLRGTSGGFAECPNGGISSGIRMANDLVSHSRGVFLWRFFLVGEMTEIRLHEKFTPLLKRIRFEDGGATVNLLFADGSKVLGRLIGDGLTFWTAGKIPAAEIVGIDEFVA